MAPITAELGTCPVRTRYAFQSEHYGSSNDAWFERLRVGAPAVELLRALLARAEAETGHYPEAFAAAGVCGNDLRSGADLRFYPSLARADVQRRYAELFSRRLTAADVEEGWLGRTSGSTGEPLRFFMDGGSIHFYAAFLRFLWGHLGLGPAPVEGTTGVVLLCTLPRSDVYSARLPLFHDTLFRKLHWAESDAAGTLTALAPAVVTGDPDSLRLLAEAAEAGEVRIAPRLIVSSAFALREELAARLARIGAAVIDCYSLAETGPVAWKCPVSKVFHVVEGAVELETDRGELVVTNLRNPLFPLIRYRTGDLGEVLPPSACRCGFGGRSIARLEGRTTARFVAADGRAVDPSQLQPLLARLAVLQFQLVQQRADAVTLRYAAPAPVPPDPTLERALGRLLGHPQILTMEYTDRLLFRPGEKPEVYRSAVAG